MDVPWLDLLLLMCAATNLAFLVQISPLGVQFVHSLVRASRNVQYGYELTKSFLLAAFHPQIQKVYGVFWLGHWGNIAAITEYVHLIVLM